MKINRNNYEIFFLDYLEGELNAGQVAELLLFVEQHPDLQQELEMMGGSLPELPNPEAEFTHKNSLKKSESGEMSRLDELFVKKLEGDLTPLEAAELDREMESNPSLLKEWEMLSLTKISSDSNLIFEDKSSLRQAEFSELELKMAAAAEGDLSEEQLSELHAELKQKDRQNELALMQASKLSPDTSVRFFNKNSLKKKVPVVGMFWRSAAAVAAVALFGFFLSPVLFDNDVETGSLADRNGVSKLDRDVSEVSKMDGESENSETFQSKDSESQVVNYASLSEQNNGTQSTEGPTEGVDRIEMQKVDRQSFKLKNAEVAFASLAKPNKSDVKIEPKEIKSAPKSSEDYMTLASLVTKKAEQVSGVDLSTGSLGEELMNRAVNLINGQSNDVVKIDVADQDESESSVKGWKFKIGKLEVSRKKAM
jgi:hypothetical protein